MNSINRCLTIGLVLVFVMEMSADFENHEKCGKINKKFIVGGEEAQKGEFPFMASLQYKKEGEWHHFCGGTVLNEEWILTAAHCIYFLTKIIEGPDDLQIVVGSVDNKDEHARKYKVDKWIIHGCFFKYPSDVLSNDITLLKTRSNISFDRDVSPICLPPKGEEPFSRNFTIAGWGVTTETTSITEDPKKSVPRLLQKTRTKLYDEEYCWTHIWFRNIGLNLSWKLGSRLCFTAITSTVCRGDSGGPAFQQVNDRVYQFGIASFISIIPWSNLCFKSNPFLYQKVGGLLDWITKSIDEHGHSSDKKISTKC